MIQQPFAPKQLEFISNATAKWNIAHGSVRSGKTECNTFAFMLNVDLCPDSKIYLVGHTCDSIKRNVVDMILYNPRFKIFQPFCTWGNRKLYYKDKCITTLSAIDEGAIGSFQGDTYSLVYCDEMTLYPTSIIEMIDSRLSCPWSKGFATMNPSHPDHIIKKWIDKAMEGDKNYYALHFTLEDNPFVDEEYKKRLANNTGGLFYKRNYLGLWCLAEGAIFDFFDRKIYTKEKPPRAADYWIAAIDYGTINAFACLLIGVSTGIRSQTGKQLWVEKEYYWDSKKTHRQKTNSEYADDVQRFLGDYDVKQLYIDPSAASFKAELRKRGIYPVDAENEVFDGISLLCSEMQKGNLLIMNTCPNLIREIEGYVWDSAKAKKGYDEPLKQNDHAIDALRYAIASHKVPTYGQHTEKHNADEYRQGRFNPGPRRFI